MNKNLKSKMPGFFVVPKERVQANLRNSGLLRAIFTSNLNILNRYLFCPDLTRGSLSEMF